ALALVEEEVRKNQRDGLAVADRAWLRAHLAESAESPERQNFRREAEFEADQAGLFAPGSVEVAWVRMLTYEALGKRERSLALAETMPDNTLRLANTYPDLAGLRSDPEFQRLLSSHHIQ